VVHAARNARATDLGALAQALCEDVGDAALVLPLALRRELEGLARRCESRDGLADDLGPAARTRYRPGVRALFVGPSGTGKTLSASWMATRLGMPLYRVDLAAVSSKYIGETEKNLGDLFARAEHAEVILLFDEADALFGKRTEVRDANDRYAYLLQRIESFEGIVLLTSNSRSRFDSAFTRRLDSILEFPAPSAEERRALWLAHLGDAHALSAGDLSRLAAGCDLAGGHIRNVVLAARALSGAGPIQRAELGQALSAEYRKLGRPLPAGVVER
jgi:SpoVK/Ycf46/Vps4 family AAA+-type ATPase